MEEPVLMEQKGEISIITLNREKTYNAFDGPTVKMLAQVLSTCAVDPGISGVVLAGKGKAFCSGGDLKWLSGYKADFGAAFHELASYYHLAIIEIKRMPKPVIAAINGFAAGGGFSLALACDFRVMDRSAVLRQAYTSNGLSIDGGGTFSLPRLVGLARAMEIAVFDGPIDSEKALEWGLVTEVVEDGAALERAMEMARGIARKSLISFQASKTLLNNSFDTTLERQLEEERKWLRLCASHPEGREGVMAFTEKRAPDFAAKRQGG